MAVRRIANDPHINPVSIADIVSDDLWCTGVEVLWCCPASRIADILVRRVCCIAILIDQVPELLGCKVEDLWCGSVAGTNCRLIKIIESRGAGFREVGEVEVDKIVT